MLLLNINTFRARRRFLSSCGKSVAGMLSSIAFFVAQFSFRTKCLEWPWNVSYSSALDFHGFLAPRKIANPLLPRDLLLSTKVCLNNRF